MRTLLILLALAAVLAAKAATTNICDRTSQVRDAILTATSADDVCAAVDLATVAGTLDLSDASSGHLSNISTMGIALQD